MKFSVWPFSTWAIPLTIQKRLFKFLLKKAIGQFLFDELDLDNLEVQVGNGLVFLKNLALNVQALNDILIDSPIFIEHGFISSITATIPWKDLWNAESTIDIQKLTLVISPKQKVQVDLFKSFANDNSLLASSIQFAGDFLKNELDDDDSDTVKSFMTARSSPTLRESQFSESGSEAGNEGIQVLALLIDNILARVKMVVDEICITVRHKSSIDIFSSNNNQSPEKVATIFDYDCSLYIKSITFEDTSPTVSNTSPDLGLLNKSQEDEIIKTVRLSGIDFQVRQKGNSEEDEKVATLFSLSENESIHFSVKIKPENQTAFSFPLGSTTHSHWNVACRIGRIQCILTPKRLSVFHSLLKSFFITDLTSKNKDGMTTASKVHRRSSDYSHRKLDINKEVLEGNSSVHQKPKKDMKPPYKSNFPIPEQFYELDINSDEITEDMTETKHFSKSSRPISPSGSSVLSSFSFDFTLDTIEIYFLLTSVPVLSGNLTENILHNLKTSEHFKLLMEEITLEYKNWIEIGSEEGDISYIELNLSVKDIFFAFSTRDQSYEKIAYFDIFDGTMVGSGKTNFPGKNLSIKKESVLDISYLSKVMEDNTLPAPYCRSENLDIILQPLVLYFKWKTIKNIIKKMEFVDADSVNSNTEIDTFQKKVISCSMATTEQKRLSAEKGNWKIEIEAFRLCVDFGESNDSKTILSSREEQLLYVDFKDIAIDTVVFTGTSEKGLPIKWISYRLHATNIYIFIKDVGATKALLLCHFNSRGHSTKILQIIQNCMPKSLGTLLMPMRRRSVVENVNQTMYEDEENVWMYVSEETETGYNCRSLGRVSTREVEILEETALSVIIDIPQLTLSISRQRLEMLLKIAKNIETLSSELALKTQKYDWNQFSMIFKGNRGIIEILRDSFEVVNEQAELNLLALKFEFILYSCVAIPNYINEGSLYFNFITEEFQFIHNHAEYAKKMSIVYTIPSISKEEENIVHNAITLHYLKDSTKNGTGTIDITLRNLTYKHDLEKNLKSKFPWAKDFEEIFSGLQGEGDTASKEDNFDLSIQLLDCGFHISKPCGKFKGIFFLENLIVYSGLNRSPYFAIHCNIIHSAFLLASCVSDQKCSVSPGCVSSEGKKHFMNKGFCEVMSLDFAKATITVPSSNSPNSKPKLQVEILNPTLAIDTCLDSFEALLLFIKAFTNIEHQEGEEKNVKTETCSTQPSFKKTGGVFDDIEENAFGSENIIQDTRAAFENLDVELVEEFFGLNNSTDMSQAVDSYQYIFEEPLNNSDFKVHKLDSDSNNLELVEDYFSSKKLPQTKILEEKNLTEQIDISIILKSASLQWRLVSGYHWIQKKKSRSENISPTPSEEPEKNHSLLTLTMSDCNLEYNEYLPDNQVGYGLDINIKGIEILDQLPTSTWKTFFGIQSEQFNRPRETDFSILRVKITSIKTRSNDMNEELRVAIKVEPVQFFIDQNALNVIISFISVLQTVQTHNPQPEDKGKETYFQYFDLSQLDIKLDYKPKRVDYTNLKWGNYVELLNIFPVEGAKLSLKEVHVTGINGIEKLVEKLLEVWLPHIYNTQISGVISGISPIKPVLNYGTGFANLVMLPIEQYKKDGQLVKGIRNGAATFIKTAAMETLHLGTKLAVGTQNILEQADDILTSDISDKPSGQVLSKFSEQPSNITEGIDSAYKSIKRNMDVAVNTVIAIPMQVYEKSGSHGAVKAVIRAVPVAVLRPMIGASEAISKTFMGIQNTMDPLNKTQSQEVMS